LCSFCSQNWWKI